MKLSVTPASLTGLNASFRTSVKVKTIFVALGLLVVFIALGAIKKVKKFERPLYAFLGFYLIFSNIKFCYKLLTDTQFKNEYLHGLIVTNDFVKIAHDQLHIELTTVVYFFFICCVLTIPLSFLLYRYQHYLFGLPKQS